MMQTTERNEGMSVPPDWINVVLGIWLVMSPFALGFSRDTAALWNNVCVGAAVTALALVSERGTGALRGLIMILAAWVFISPFLLGFSRTAFLWNNIVAAFLIISGAAISEGLHPTYREAATSVGHV